MLKIQFCVDHQSFMTFDFDCQAVLVIILRSGYRRLSSLVISQAQFISYTFSSQHSLCMPIGTCV